MPCSKRVTKCSRDSTGAFVSNKKLKVVLSDSEPEDFDIDIEEFENPSNPDYDAEYEPSESELDDESDDEYLAMPEPATWHATLSANLQPSATIQVHSMRDADLHFDGPIDKKGGAKDKTGRLRGAYLVGGISQREAERR
ncbi:hypothetical protein B0H11DRAFT_1931195 [Mycena galericulata]|nr:hypothetical protein B0H11DRAFT_1931195 [Mycena galericulata]